MKTSTLSIFAVLFLQNWILTMRENRSWAFENAKRAVKEMYGDNLTASKAFLPDGSEMRNFLEFPGELCTQLFTETSHYELLVETLELGNQGPILESNQAWEALFNYLAQTHDELIVQFGAHGANDVSLTQSNYNTGEPQKYLTFIGDNNRFKDTENNECRLTITDSSSTAILHDLSSYAIDQEDKHYWFFCLMIKFEVRVGLEQAAVNDLPVHHNLTFRIIIHNLCTEVPETHNNIFGEVRIKAVKVESALPTIVTSTTDLSSEASAPVRSRGI